MEALTAATAAFPIFLLSIGILFLVMYIAGKKYTSTKGLPIKELPEWMISLDNKLEEGWQQSTPKMERHWLTLMREIDMKLDYELL